MAHYYRKQEEQKKLQETYEPKDVGVQNLSQEDEDDSYLDSEWANPKAQTNQRLRLVMAQALKSSLVGNGRPGHPELKLSPAR